MRILHINSYYFTNKIHKFFRKEQENQGIKCDYFIPLYKNGNHYFRDDGVTTYDIYRGYDKVFFFTKIIKSIYTIRRKIDIKKYSLIHAHTLVSDGFIAYFLYIFFKIPYVVTVRNTDLNFFLPNFFFKWSAKFIAKNARTVFFLSPSYRDKFQKIYPYLHFKSEIIPNGIENHWFTEIQKTERVNKEPINLLFIGRVDKNKNLDILIDFLKSYDDRHYVLTIVGSNVLQMNFEKINLTLKGSNEIIFNGVVNSGTDLRDIVDKSDIFVMLSFNESFGVSYIESIARGKPIIYTRNEGVDGFFNKVIVGGACDPNNVKELKAKIDFIIAEYPDLTSNCIQESKTFNWKIIVEKYLNTLNQV